MLDRVAAEAGLLSGFASAAVPELERIRTDNSQPRSARTRASWLLAQHYANIGDFARSLTMLESAQPNDPKSRSIREYLLYRISIFQRLEKIGLATKDIKQLQQKIPPASAELYLTRANSNYFANREELPLKECDSGRLELFNAMFAAREFSPVGLVDLDRQLDTSKNWSFRGW